MDFISLIKKQVNHQANIKSNNNHINICGVLVFTYCLKLVLHEYFHAIKLFIHYSIQ